MILTTRHNDALIATPPAIKTKRVEIGSGLRRTFLTG